MLVTELGADSPVLDYVEEILEGAATEKMYHEAPLDAIALCWAKLTPDFLRSRSNYTKVPHLLQIARDIAIKSGEESKWAKRLQRFATEHRGKKQSMELIDKALTKTAL